MERERIRRGESSGGGTSLPAEWTRLRDDPLVHSLSEHYEIFLKCPDCGAEERGGLAPRECEVCFGADLREWVAVDNDGAWSPQMLVPPRARSTFITTISYMCALLRRRPLNRRELAFFAPLIIPALHAAQEYTRQEAARKAALKMRDNPTGMHNFVVLPRPGLFTNAGVSDYVVFICIVALLLFYVARFT